MLKKSFAVLLAALILSSAFMTGCSESTENAETTSTADTAGNAADPSVEETEELETTRMYADIPADANFDGYTFTILCNSNSEYGIVQNDFAAEELTGEPINDAKYNRNLMVQDKLNVTINSESTPNALTNQGVEYIQKDVQGGTHAYDLTTLCAYSCVSLAMDNCLYNMKEVPYINLGAKWWDQVANESLEVIDQLFFTTGDITISDNDATYCIMFNKQLIQDYSLENPYELVENSKWTMDKFIEMAENVSADLNGDGKFNQEDRYGALVWDDTMMGVVNCSGAKCAIVNEDGLFELTLNTEQNIDVITTFLDFTSQKNIVCAYQRLNWNDSLLVNMFSGDQGLFLTQLIQLVPKMRDMDTDFGILPMFKYKETQDKYYTCIGSWHSVFVAVPNGQENLERTGIVTEFLSCEGLYDLTEAYYEKTLKGKTTRDEESRAMLDIIFESRVYDNGWYYSFGYGGNVMDMFRNYQNNFASMYKQSERVKQKTLQKVNEAYEDLKLMYEAMGD